MKTAALDADPTADPYAPGQPVECDADGRPGLTGLGLDRPLEIAMIVAVAVVAVARYRDPRRREAAMRQAEAADGWRFKRRTNKCTSRTSHDSATSIHHMLRELQVDP